MTDENRQELQTEQTDVQESQSHTQEQEWDYEAFFNGTSSEEEETTEEETQIEEGESQEEQESEEGLDYDWEEELSFSLVDGEEPISVKLSDLRDTYKAKQDLQTNTLKLVEAAQQLQQREQEAMTALELARLETDIILQDLDNTNWDSLDAEQFKSTSLKQRQIREKAAQIKSQLERLGGNKTTTDNVTKERQALQTFQKLNAEVPNFDKTLYNNSIQFAVKELGVSPEVADTLDAGILKAFIAAYQAKGGASKPLNGAKQGLPKKSIKKSKATPSNVNKENMEDWAMSFFK